MSTPGIPDNLPPKETSPKIPFGALLTILVAIALLIFSLIFWQFLKTKGNKNARLSNNNTDTQEISDLPIPLPPEPERLFAYSGNIIKIEVNNIFINSSVRKGNNYQDETIKVLTNENTEFLRRDISKISLPLPPGQEQENTDMPEKISLSDLKEGDSITASSSENIKDKEEFMATSVVVSFNSLED